MDLLIALAITIVLGGLFGGSISLVYYIWFMKEIEKQDFDENDTIEQI